MKANQKLGLAYILALGILIGANIGFYVRHRQLEHDNAHLRAQLLSLLTNSTFYVEGKP